MEMFFSMSADVYSDFAIGLTLINYPKMNCPNQSTGSKDTVKSIFMSADLYSHRCSDLTFGWSLKNYPKMTLHFPKSIHWFKIYNEINYVSRFVQS